ncbi:MAG: hypothetical protein ACI87E_003278 [Mariniblastus sp.]|jgi:hypothetical protein
MISSTTWPTWVLSFFSTTNLQLILLSGSGILAISLLVLAMTRWGHSRPVWKCVILSFVAHILLIGYAYGTRMIFDSPPVVQKSPPMMRVSVVEDKGESKTGEDLVVSAKNSWDQFHNEQALPALAELERPVIDSEVIIEKLVDRGVEKPKLELNPGLDVIPQKLEKREIVVAPQPDLIDFQTENLLVDPQEIEIARRGAGAQPKPVQLVFDVPEEMARQEVNNDAAPLAEAENFPMARAPLEQEKAFISDLLDAKSDLPIAPESLPRPAAAPKFEHVKPLRPIPRNNSFRIVSSPRRIGDGQPLPKVYSLRSVETRGAIARQRGGTLETEQAVESALIWLANRQREDGSWSSAQSGGGREDKIFGHNRNGAGAQADCGITALATLAFLASGQSHLEGKYQKEVQSGLEFLVRSQKTDGDLSGNARLFAKMYCHSMSLLALSEALAMTGDQRLMPAVQRGVNFTVNAQDRRDGGWRYAPGDSGDMSQFGWQVLALHSAKLGNAHVPPETFDRMQNFLESCTSGIGKGLASYRPKQGPSTTMTAEALLCRYFLQNNVNATTLMEATRRIGTELPTPHHVNLYYWYYGTLAMYHAGGSDWERWNTELKKTLLTLQIKTGNKAGSWPANGVWGGYGGEVYSTAMATLSLEVYYRYLPIYQEVADASDREPSRR